MFSDFLPSLLPAETLYEVARCKMAFPWWRFRRTSPLVHRGLFLAPSLKVFRFSCPVNLQRLPWHPWTMFVSPLQVLELSLLARLLLAETLAKFWILQNLYIATLWIFLLRSSCRVGKSWDFLRGELQWIWKESSLKTVWAPLQKRAALKVEDVQPPAHLLQDETLCDVEIYKVPVRFLMFSGTTKSISLP